MNEESAFVLAITVIAAMIFGTISVTHLAVNTEWRADTVARGLAQYCPTDGAWAWKGECE
jgi:hypothetical protein